jgi:hypothetical protein
MFNRLRKLLAGRGVVRAYSRASASASASANLIKLVDCYRVYNSSLALVSPKTGLGSLSKDLS